MRNGMPQRPAGFPSGKLLLILIIVSVSSVSFVLGYFVGTRSGTFSDKGVIEIRPAEKEAAPVAESDIGKTAAEITSDMDAVKNTSPVPAKPEETAPPVLSAKTAEGPFGVKAAAPPKTPDQKSQKRSFSVQAGAFTRTKEANTLKSNLAKKGYNTYIEAVKAGSGKVYKVKVGKFTTRAEAEKILAELKKMKGMKPFIVVIK